MSDELDRLRAALKATRPEPDPAARRQALDAALGAFEDEKARKNATASQGLATEDRHSSRGASWFARLFGGRSMKFPHPGLKSALMGGASLAVIALAVVVTQDLRHVPDPGDYNHFSGGATSSAPTESRTERDEESPIVAAAPQPAGSGGMSSLAGRETVANEAPATGDDGTATVRRAGRLDSRKTEGEAATAPQSEVTDAVAAIPSTSAPAGRFRAAGELKADTGAVRQHGLQATGQYAAGISSDSSSAARVQLAPAPDLQPQIGYQEQGRDNFADFETNPVKVTAEEPVSTFSIDVDTASYSFVRRELLQGVLPQKDAVRIEEMVNYFPYDYPRPESSETPFRADVQVIPTPWNPGTRLMRIGIQGYELAEAEKPRSNLVFLLDVSGSMNAPDKLPLLKNSFRLMLNALDPDDSVAIVVYAGAAGTVLEPTRVAESGKILAALDQLRAGGSTAGGEGIRQAYRLAEQSFDAEGVNRVILATDGDFNVGITDPDELKGFVERERKSGVFLSVLGFGQGNLNDALMQALAQNGNGQAAYIDTLNEARKALVEEAGSTLFPIAKDVKIQVEFNPATVAEYRLIGYETRMLRREDFNNDKVDAGEIGSGHRVTALYEITPVGSDARAVDDLRYQPAAESGAEPEQKAQEYGFLKIRYKAPNGDTSKLITTPVTHAMDVAPDADSARETRFAAAVAGFGQLLRGGRHMGDFGYDDVAKLAQGARGDDPYGYRTEFVNLVRLAKSAAALEPLK